MKTEVREFCGKTAENGEICGPSAGQMSDAEIIATFMEPNPKLDLRRGPDTSRSGFWYLGRPYSGDETLPDQWYPSTLTLDALHEVETKLKRELIAEGREYRWWEYGKTLFAATDGDCWHATPEQKITALAAVLRPVVEGNQQQKA